MVNSQGRKSKRGRHHRRTRPSQQGGEKFILCGHINLHKSDTCNAQFAHYLNNSLSGLDFDGKKFTNDMGHVHKRGERPVNVSQWNQRRANGTLGSPDSDSEGAPSVAGRTQASNSSSAGVLAGGRAI